MPRTPSVCNWCSGRVAATARTCRSCGAAAPKPDLDIPGLTSVDESLREVEERTAARLIAITSRRTYRFAAAVVGV